MLDPWQPTTVEMLDRLIGFDTTSRNSNLTLIDSIRSYLDAHCVFYRVSHDRTGTKANLHAVIGPRTAGGIALSGHVDTVPVDDQHWTSDPFRLRQADDGRLFGRGTSDMKGFVAACLAAVPAMTRAGLRRPIHLFISYDEEIDCDGARVLIRDLTESGLRPAACIVGEPSEMKPILAHKGRLALQVTVRGKSGHSSEPARGVNAIYAAGEAIGWIAAEGRRFAEQGPFEDGFEPPHTTIHVGTLTGGTILNIIPEQARFVMEWRTIPADDFFREVERLREVATAQIEPAMKAVDPSTGFEFEVTDWIPGLSLPPDHDLMSLVQQLTGANAAGKVSYGTEAGLFEAAGVPSIVCGPGSIQQAHQPDEFIARSELDSCDAFLRRLIARLSADGPPLAGVFAS